MDLLGPAENQPVGLSAGGRARFTIVSSVSSPSGLEDYLRNQQQGFTSGIHSRDP